MLCKFALSYYFLRLLMGLWVGESVVVFFLQDDADFLFAEGWVFWVVLIFGLS